jgi:hypothetical protein
MIYAERAQRPTAAAGAATIAAVAISLSAFIAGPLTASSAWQLTTSTVAAEVSSTIRDVLTAAHAAIHADRSDIVADRQTIRDTRRQSAKAIGASVLEGSVGEGQIQAIVDTARSANRDERQAISETRVDIRQTRQAAATDVRAVIAGNHDGSTAQAVKAIVDTAKTDNAMTRSAITAYAQENAAIRRAGASDNMSVRTSARAGDITKQDAAQQISANRHSAHAELADNHAQMREAHQQIGATRAQAARDVATTVHEGRTGD